MNILKAKRKEMDFTLEELSKKANLSTMALSNYENSKRHPCFQDIWKIKELYELSDAELIAWIKSSAK